MSLSLSSVLAQEGGQHVEPAVSVQPKRGRGKPTLYTSTLSQVILKDIEQGVPKTKAYVANGISLQTGYDWEKAHPEFAQAVKCAREKFRVSRQDPCVRTSQRQPPFSVTPGKFPNGDSTPQRPSQRQAKATLTIVLSSK